jgi:gas vesicle protein
MAVLLTLWIVSLLGIAGTIWFRFWQIQTGRVNPDVFDPEVENPLAPARIETNAKRLFTVIRERARAIFIRVLHVLALFMYRIRVKIDTLVKKMIARIEHEEGVLEANRKSEQFLSTISEYKETLRQTAQTVSEEVRETVAEITETITPVVEVVKKPIIRRKRKPKIITPVEEVHQTEVTEEPPRAETATVEETQE